MLNLSKNLLLILSAILLVACGGSDSTTATPAATDTTPAGFQASEATNITLPPFTDTAVLTASPTAATSGTIGTDEITLEGLAIRFNDSTAYTRENGGTAWDIADSNKPNLQIARTLTLSQIDSDDKTPALTATFDGDGLGTGITLYADADYTTGVTAVTGSTANTSIFGFNSQYMAYVTWNSAQTATDLDETATTGTLTTIDGVMIAGIETTDIPTAGATIFMGAGKGIYGVLVDGAYTTYNTTYTTEATIDFTNTSLDFSTDGTVCDISCTLPDGTDLDLTATGLDFADGNNISGDISTTLASDLSGTLDARFYGGNIDELGGTFALTSASNYYYGAFGGERGYLVETSETATTTASGEDPKLTTSFNYTGGSGLIITLNLDNLIRITDNSNSKAITLDEVTGAEVNYYYNQNGFVSSVAAISFATKTYEAQTTTGTSQKLTGTGVTGGDTGVTINNFQINRGSDTAGDAFGFTGDYIALVSWDETHNDFTSFGYGITGFETATLTASNIANFAGKGQGRYENADGTNVNTFFNITATANFGENMVSLASTGTCDSSDCTGTAYADLDFSGNLSYVGTANALTGTINTASNALTGTADAKFYGGGSEEFGGTFRLNEGTSGYVGYFGGERGWLISTSTIATQASFMDTGSNVITVPTDITTITDYADGFDNTALTGAITIALNMSNVVQATKDTTAETITNHHYTDSVAEITYDASGNITEVSTYFDNKKYTGTGSGSSATSFSGVTLTSSDGTPPTSSLALSRSAFRNFDFTAKYMARIRWRSDELQRGVGIAGFETIGTNIPDTGGEVTFAGKGVGVYIDDTYYYTYYFNVETKVDFSKPTEGIAFSTSNTCNDSDFSECTATKLRYHLNMKGTLDYTADTNAITGSVITKGGSSTTNVEADYTTLDGTELTGTANARFYGPAAEEIGGTFSVTSDSESFTGFFGAE